MFLACIEQIKLEILMNINSKITVNKETYLTF